MDTALSKVLIKIFAGGFYKVHSGLFLFTFLVLVGAVEPSQILNYHKLLMIAFISSPLMLLVVVGIWLIYSAKAWHYAAGEIFAVNQTFLFYSINSFTKRKQFRAWFQVQAVVMAPIAIYGLIATGVGVFYHYYLVPIIIILYLVLLASAGAWLYCRLVSRLIDGGRASLLLKWGGTWRKPYFSLFIYHVFDQMKVKYVIIKGLSYLIITAIFYLFADVSHDTRVAGIAVLAIVTAHTVIIFQLRVFEETWLKFSRNLPYTRLQLFAGFFGIYACLLLPEAIWLFSRFHPISAAQLFLLALSIALFYHGLLYRMGLDMDKYLQYILGCFLLLFWLIMFRLLPVLIALNFVAGFALFYRNYYKTVSPPAS